MTSNQEIKDIAAITAITLLGLIGLVTLAQWIFGFLYEFPNQFIPREIHCIIQEGQWFACDGSGCSIPVPKEDVQDGDSIELINCESR